MNITFFPFPTIEDRDICIVNPNKIYFNSEQDNKRLEEILESYRFKSITPVLRMEVHERVKKFFQDVSERGGLGCSDISRIEKEFYRLQSFVAKQELKIRQLESKIQSMKEEL